MPDSDRVLHAIERMSKLLALVAVKDVENKVAVLTLLRAGYSQAEVATLLDMKVSAVSMVVLRSKARNSPKKPTPTAAADGDGE